MCNAVKVALPAACLSLATLFPHCRSNETGPQSTNTGKQWLTYTNENSELVSNAVACVAFDAPGRTWIGTSGGVSQLYHGVWQSFTAADGLPVNQVNAIAFGRDGSVWFGTGGGGVSRYRQNYPQQEWTTYGVSQGLPDQWIYSMAISYYGDLWIGTNNGAGQFVQSPTDPAGGGQWFDYGTADGLPGSIVTAVAADRNNVLWFGTARSGIATYDGVQWRSYPLPQGENIRVTSMAVDAGNAIWLGTWRGLLKFDGVNWTVYDTTKGFPDEFAISVAVEGGSVIWAGTYRGAARLNGSAWTVFSTSNSGLVSDTVLWIAADSYSNVWFGTPRGVSVYNPKGVQQ